MAVLRSRLDPGSDEARANCDALMALVADLRARTAAVGGVPEATTSRSSDTAAAASFRSESGSTA
jgi:hypothetical protein